MTVRFIAFRREGQTGLAVGAAMQGYRGLTVDQAGFPGTMEHLLAAGNDALPKAAAALQSGAMVDLDQVTLLPPISAPSKIICVGLNYKDHSAESGMAQPDYPTLFARFTSSLIAHGDPIIRPKNSEKLDYEGELVAVIGKGGRHITKEAALDHVAGYSIFNDGSVRDFQLRTPQWTMGKNFDGTGAFGPEFVTADELPRGGVGLKLVTRLNGVVMQSASTGDLVFDVATLVSGISEAMTLEPGDLIVTGTPAGVGAARKPPVWMKAGDICEVEIENVGVLRNTIADES